MKIWLLTAGIWLLLLVVCFGCAPRRPTCTVLIHPAGCDDAGCYATLMIAPRD
jgi:hypothetical protein